MAVGMAEPAGIMGRRVSHSAFRRTAVRQDRAVVHCLDHEGQGRQ